MPGITIEPVPDVDLFGPRLSFPIGSALASTDFAVMRGLIPPGGFIPLHAHASRETFYVLSGAMEGWLDGAWRSVAAGSFLDIPSGHRHAMRNRTDRLMNALVVTSVQLAIFLDQAGRPVVAGETLPPPEPADFLHFDTVAEAAGVWVGSAADNLAIGLGPVGN